MFERMRKKNLGQSLLEVIVAIGVVLSVLISISGLVAINVFGQKSSENRVLASQLAREGIEAIRNFRDTTLLKKWTLAEETGEYSESAHYYYITNFNSDNNNRWKLNQGVSGWGSQYDLGLSASNFYEPGGAAYNGLKRRILIDSLCQSSSDCALGDPGICDSLDAGVCTSRIGYRVTSEVQWLENNQTQSLKLVDFLYDWR